MMTPISVETDGDKFIITHKCEICGKIKRQRTSDADNMDEIIRISHNSAFIFGK